MFNQMVVWAGDCICDMRVHHKDYLHTLLRLMNFIISTEIKMRQTEGVQVFSCLNIYNRWLWLYSWIIITANLIYNTHLCNNNNTHACFPSSCDTNRNSTMLSICHIHRIQTKQSLISSKCTLGIKSNLGIVEIHFSWKNIQPQDKRDLDLPEHISLLEYSLTSS